MALFRVASLFLVALCAVALPAAAQVQGDLLLSKRPQKLLSAYGLFSDGSQQIPAEGVVPYDLQVPLFTDYAEKYRFAYVPAGQPAVYHDSEVFDFPVGSVLVKTFAYPADLRKPEENVKLIETRLLIHQEAGWNAWAYVWNEDQSDATLKVAGKVLPLVFVNLAGEPQSINYVVPNKNQCKGCHSFDRAVTPIGPKARNLNKDYVFSTGIQNQLIHWSDIGFLEGAPEQNQIPTVPAMEDLGASLNDRARAYLDINCAHCHRAEGPGSTSGLFLTYGEQSAVTWGYEKRPVAAGRGSGGFTYDIAPGNADESILLYRMISTDPGVMMPEVGRTLAHEEGLKLIRDWINALE